MNPLSELVESLAWAALGAAAVVLFCRLRRVELDAAYTSAVVVGHLHQHESEHL